MKAVDKFEFPRGYKFPVCDVVDRPGHHARDWPTGAPTIRYP